MPPRMIRVRHKDTGEERLLGESAFPYFAGIYERVDLPTEPSQAPDAPAAEEPAEPGKSSGRRAATTDKKEKG
ncbi:hypothetical protein ACBJ59_61325 [Nonomuraea sp. MTCD27]|uniref:hypothetical protein n=1 Tax=Nonomuraea sp. MTCD27 TaxID=1676747 RepID=UPI0035C04B25